MKRISLFLILTLLIGTSGILNAQIARQFGARRFVLDNNDNIPANNIYIIDFNGSLGIDNTGLNSGTYPNTTALVSLLAGTKTTNLRIDGGSVWGIDVVNTNNSIRTSGSNIFGDGVGNDATTVNISGTGNLTLNGIAAPASPSPLSNLLYLNASNQVQQTPAGVNVVSGSGTLNTVPLWTPNGNTLGNSLITQPTIAGIAVTPTSAGNALTVNNFSAASTAIKINANGGTGINIDPAGTGIQLDATGTGISFVNSNPTTGINLRAATTGINIAVNPSAWGMDYQGAGLINGGIRILGNSGINTGFQAGSAGSTVTNAFFASATQPAGVLSNGFHATTDQGTITNGVLVDNTLAGTITNGVRVNLVGGNSTNGMRVTNGGAGTITNGLLVENTSTGSITTGIISNNTSLGSLTKAIRASGNSPSTGVAVASNIALQVDQGELTMGRGHDDDAVAGNIAGPSGIINSGIFPVPSAATTGAVPGAPLGGGPTKIKGSNGFFAFNDYVNANSIVLATVINNNPPVVGEAVLGANESVEVRVGRSTNGVTFHISRSCDPVLGPGAGATAGFFRIGYLVINPIR